MKNYYYFLGISPNASQEVIKIAYRKLSNKYHPDKNPNDDFFNQRFIETKEAYDVLSNQEKKQIFDKKFRQYLRGYRTQDAPKINQFRSNQFQAKIGDKIILSWFTENADLVKIIPIGLIDAQGETSFEIKEFENKQMIFLLHATNTSTNKTIVQRLIVYQISNDFSLENTNIQIPINNNSKKNPPKISNNILMFIIVLFLIIILTFVSIIKNTFGAN